MASREQPNSCPQRSQFIILSRVSIISYLRRGDEAPVIFIPWAGLERPFQGSTSPEALFEG
jgi:hypothetical protein